MVGVQVKVSKPVFLGSWTPGEGVRVPGLSDDDTDSNSSDTITDDTTTSKEPASKGRVVNLYPFH